MSGEERVVDLFGHLQRKQIEGSGHHCGKSEGQSASSDQLDELAQEVAALRRILARLIAHVVSTADLGALDDIVIGDDEMDLPLEQTATLAEVCLEAARVREGLRL